MIWLILFFVATAAFGIWRFVANFNEEERRNKEALANLVQERGWTFEGAKGETKWTISGKTDDDIPWRLVFDGLPGSDQIPKLRWRLDLPAKSLCVHIQKSQILRAMRSPAGLAISDLVNGLTKSTIGADFETLTTFVGVAPYTQLDNTLGACASFSVGDLVGAFASSAPDRENLEAQWGQAGLEVSIKGTESIEFIARIVDWSEELSRRLRRASAQMGTASLQTTHN